MQTPREKRCRYSFITLSLASYLFVFQLCSERHRGPSRWAADYPHPDHPGDYLEELRGMVEGMTTNARRGVLGENVARAYKLLEV